MPTQTFYNLPEEKQSRIVAAAIDEFGRCNVTHANLSNIVSAAGIARGSIYKYFDSKEDMYIYIFEILRAQRAEYAKPAMELYKKEPFIVFFKDFYLRDSEYLFAHPKHIELGKQLYADNQGVSRRLIQNIQMHYRDMFIIAIEFDKARNLIREDVDTAVLADLFTHFMTDIFIFQSVSNELTMRNIRQHATETLRIIQFGIQKNEL
ncbi:MAG: TetR/AcrR family transcriptional regulator [Lachnospiraceae bacterium]|jgi:AcrR family transcriptional regulator|nr:TetR/AcrR family transcriptional regulator [Lachnospiraceae bacterium]